MLGLVLKLGLVPLLDVTPTIAEFLLDCVCGVPEPERSGVERFGFDRELALMGRGNAARSRELALLPLLPVLYVMICALWLSGLPGGETKCSVPVMRRTVLIGVGALERTPPGVEGSGLSNAIVEDGLRDESVSRKA